MATVIFYNFILLSSTFFVWASEKGKGRLERYVFLGVAFLLVFVPSAIRYDVGTDYMSYLGIYENSWRLENYKYKEPAFYFINWIYKSIGAHYQWVFATFSFIFTAAAFKAYPRKNAWLLHFLFFSNVMLFSYSGLRQAIAIAFSLYAMKEWLLGEWKKAFLILIVGGTFHNSLFVFALVLAISFVPVKLNFKRYIFPIISLVLVIVAFLTPLIIKAVEIGLLYVGSGYASYIEGRFYRETEIGTGLGMFFYAFFVLYYIFYAKNIMAKNSRYWGVSLLALFYLFSRALAAEIHIFVRMVDIFNIVPVLVAFLLLVTAKKRSNLSRMMGVLFIIVIFLTFNKVALTSLKIGKGLGINPYSSILEADYRW